MLEISNLLIKMMLLKLLIIWSHNMCSSHQHLDSGFLLQLFAVAGEGSHHAE